MPSVLPADVVRHISDYVGCASLSHTCKWAWEILQHRHLHCRLDSTILSQRSAQLTDDVVHTLSATCTDLGIVGARGLQLLGLSTSLRTVSLNLRRCNLGDEGAGGLAVLKDIWCLHTLELNLSSNSISCTGLTAPPCLQLLVHTRGHTIVAVTFVVVVLCGVCLCVRRKQSKTVLIEQWGFGEGQARGGGREGGKR